MYSTLTNKYKTIQLPNETTNTLIHTIFISEEVGFKLFNFFFRLYNNKLTIN